MNYDDWGEKPLPQIDPESEAYWEATRDGDLAVQHCGDCGERQFYPRELCRHCWSRDLSLETVEGTGEVYSYTVCFTPGQPGYGDETPYSVALVELDLPSANPSARPVRLTTHVVDCADEDLRVDMDVAVTFRDVGDDPPVSLPVFRPREG